MDLTSLSFTEIYTKAGSIHFWHYKGFKLPKSEQSVGLFCTICVAEKCVEKKESKPSSGKVVKSKKKPENEVIVPVPTPLDKPRRGAVFYLSYKYSLKYLLASVLDCSYTQRFISMYYRTQGTI